MKIVLTHSYFLNEDVQEQRIMKPYPPLGLLYLSAYLKQNNYPVQVYDTTFSTFEELISFLMHTQPDILGIYTNLLTKFTVLKLIDYCREAGIISILGGPDAATQIPEFLTYGADIIVSGEGEHPLLSVLQKLEKTDKHSLHGIPNVSFKDAKGKIVQNQRQFYKMRLDDYPFPDRQAIDMEAYFSAWETHHGMRPVSLITARGCAFTCKWCSHSVYGWTHRRRTPENVLQEIQQIIAQYHPTHLWFADDVFTVNKHWIRHFRDLLTSHGIHLPFECIARADRLDEEMVVLLKEMGCYRIWFGAESGSQSVLDAMSRGVTAEQIEKATRWCQQNGIQAGVFVMFGYPGENLSDVQQSIRFIADLQPDHYLTTVAYPLRGTHLYEEIKEKIVAQTDWQHYLQRELEIEGRYPRAFYYFAIRKLASEYRYRQLPQNWKQIWKKYLHRGRSFFADLMMKYYARKSPSSAENFLKPVTLLDRG